MKQPKLRKLFKNASVEEVAKDQTIFGVGKTQKQVYFVEAGFIGGFSTNRIKGRTLVEVHKPGEVFPLATYLTGRNHQFPIEYCALTESTIRKISILKLKRVLKSDPGVIREILNQMSQRNIFFRDQVSLINLEEARKRVMAKLVALIYQFGSCDGKAVSFKLPLTQAEIASSIALSRESVSKIISQLEREKLLTYSQEMVTIPDYYKFMKAIYLAGS